MNQKVKKEVENELIVLYTQCTKRYNYQILITVLFFIALLATDFISVSLPALELPPYVIKSDGSEVALTYDYCDEHKDNIQLSTNKKVSSLIVDLEIYCSRTKVLLLGIALVIGGFLGGIFAYYFPDRYGRKSSIRFYLPIYCLLLLSFRFVYKTYILIFFIFILVEICAYAIHITLLSYLSEIVLPDTVPTIVSIALTSRPVAGVVYFYMFYLFGESSWRNGIYFVIGLDCAAYILLLLFMVESPIYHLNNNDNENFRKTLEQIARFNRVRLKQKDFDFLDEEFLYLRTSNLSEGTSGKASSGLIPINEVSSKGELSSGLYNSNSNSQVVSSGERNSSESRENSKNQSGILGEIGPLDPEDDLTGFKKDAVIIENVSQSNSNDNDNELYANLLADRNPYGGRLSEGTGSVAKSRESVVKLFKTEKMKDISPLILFKYKSQLKPLLIQTFLWSVTLVLLDGVSLQAKEVRLDSEENFNIFQVYSFALDFLGYVLIIILLTYTAIELQKLLITYELISFITIMFSQLLGRAEETKNSGSSFLDDIKKIFFLFVCKFCWDSLYLLQYILNIESYTSMVKMKGVGWTKGFAKLFAIVAPFFVDSLNYDESLKAYEVLAFFSMLFTYKLPNQIGALNLFEIPEEARMTELKEKLKKYDDNFKK